jgi:hypothetical protein
VNVLEGHSIVSPAKRSGGIEDGADACAGTTFYRGVFMHIDDAISELIGALANVLEKNHSEELPLANFLNILSNAEIETSGGNSYSNPSVLINKASEYWEEKDRPSVVRNIRNHLS